MTAPTPVRPVELHHNPLSGPLPDVYARRYSNTLPIPDAGSCGRCNRDHAVHVWLLVDPDEAEQGGVIDCATNDGH